MEIPIPACIRGRFCYASPVRHSRNRCQARTFLIRHDYGHESETCSKDCNEDRS